MQFIYMYSQEPLKDIHVRYNIIWYMMYTNIKPKIIFKHTR